VKGTCLSFRQPWGTLAVLGLKPIDNRPWSTEYRGRLFIHTSAAKKLYFPRPFSDRWIADRLDQAGRDLYYTTPRPRGAIIGEADLVDCVQESASPWFVGPFGLVLANPKRYDKPIPYTGALKLYEIELEGEPICSTN